jgi:glycosyltransferase involved in cell wall biosynthesis
MTPPRLSIVIPVFNEGDNVLETHAELVQVLGADAALRRWWPGEILFVDDGSTDDTLGTLRTLATRDHRVVVIALTRNFGQTGALACGQAQARGDVIVVLDGDLQNDPRDISLLLEQIDQGHPIVCGWRRDRTDWRRLPTGLANWIVRKVSGVPLHDCAFPLKAIRREYLERLRFTGEMHRYLGVYASLFGGAPVVEVPVRHRFRRRGRSKYGLDRVYKLLPDLLLLKLLHRFAGRPMHLFGGFGVGLLLLAVLSAIGSAIWIVARGASVASVIPALVALGLTCAACFAFGLGFLGDMLLRTRGPIAAANTADAWPLYSVKEIWRNGRCVASPAGSDVETRTF